MRKNLTYIIFVVDRSGSMGCIAKDMIGGYNAFIKAQRDAKLGDCKVFFYQFDTEYDAVYEGIDLEKVAGLTDKTYVPRGSTALYPAVGKTIVGIGEKLNLMPESERPEKVLMVVITDGEHNARFDNRGEKNYTCDEVKDMIEHQTKVYNWDFTYIGANQNAWAVGDSMGMAGNVKMNYTATAAGTAMMFDKLSKGTVSYRSAAGAKFAYAYDDDDVKANQNPANVP